MLHLYEKGIEVLRKKISDNDTDTYWNNYTFVIWKKNIGGFSDTKGVYRNNNWGIAYKFPVNSKGNWELPLKYVRHFK